MNTTTAPAISTRAAYVLANYYFRAIPGGFEAVSLFRGKIFSRFEGPDADALKRLARCQWGHFNFEDESRAFNTIFR